MPNNQPLEDIISESSKRSILDAQANSEKLNKTLQETIILRKQLNDTMAGAKTMGDVNATAAKEQKIIEQTNKLIAQRQLAEEKLATFKAAQQAKLDAAEAKQLKADNDRIARIKRIEDAEISRAKKLADADAKALASSQQITGQEANAAAAISNTERVESQRVKTKKLSNLEQEKANQLAKIDRLNLVAQAKEGNAVKGSLEQRQLALARLQKTYTSLSAEERKSPFGQRMATVIPQLNTQVLTLEKSLGKSQREVGNYGNAFARAGQKAFGALRTIANILPGLGIAGLLGFLVTPIIEAVSQLDIFKKKAIDTIRETAAASSEFKNAIADVQSLKTSISEFNQGTITGKELVDRYNDTIGKTAGILKTTAEVEDFYNKQAGNYIEGVTLRAQAQAALELATEKATEATKRAIEGPNFGDYASSVFANLPELISGSFNNTIQLVKGDFTDFTKGFQSDLNLIGNYAGKAKTQSVRDLSKSAKDRFKIFDELKKKADKFLKDNNLNFNTQKDSKGAKLPDPAIQARKNAAALLQVQIELAKEEADIYKSQMDNLNYSLGTRLDSQLKFEEQMSKISKLESQKSKAEKVNSKQEIEAIEAKSQKEISKFTREGVETRLKIIKEEADEAEKLRLTIAERVLTNIEKQRDEELIVLNKQYSRGLITLEQFEQGKLNISKKYALIELAEQIKQAEALIEIQKATGIDTTDAEAKLTAIKLKRLSLITDATKEENEKQIQSEKEKFETIKELGEELFNFAATLSNGIFEKNIANLEEEKEIRQRNTDLQIENVNESVASEQQKAEQINVINQNSANAQNQIDERIKAEKRKQAIADKAFALTSIAINTAIAVSKVLGQTGIFGLAASIPVIALGAIQAATVLAQPIPKFAKGGVMKKDGLAEYGHGTELRINPDGATSLTPDKPEIGFVKKGTRFISAPETKKLMAKPDLGKDIAGKSWDIMPIVNSYDNGVKRIEKAINKLAKKNNNAESRQNLENIKSYYKRNGL